MGKFSNFKLPLKTLPEGESDYSFHLDKEFFANMENEEIHDADIDVKLVATRRGDDFSLSFTFTGTLTLLCTRCLDDLIYPIDTQYHVTVEFGDEYRDESDDLLIIPISDPSLNVAFMIYDTIALSIPMKHVHPQGKCNRQMSALLRKHRGRPAADEDAELEDELLDGIDDEPAGQPADSRWDALRGLASSSSDE
ncbi:MAG: DUF177 domain-containing protein [Pseudoflavonifractor sp.]|nr:DUF177 domain-containing protein [Alloprevotella sp.]MCM1116181.1 DUF177 domain-containing protein [Pseudoflavonifractor sp.]